MDRIGLLQLDSVNVVVRSHYMPLFSRLGSYDRTLIDRYAYDNQELFEYWGHEASLLPMDTYPLYRHRMGRTHAWKRYTDLMENDPTYMDRVLHEVRTNGPLIASDLKEPGERTGPWWGYSKGKVALEWLFMTGAIACSHRVNFTRFYDLSENVIPEQHFEAPALSEPEAHRQMMRLAARSHGVGTAADLADYYRIKLRDAQPQIDALVASGELVEAAVEGWSKPAYMPEATVTPRSINGAALLTPFDPVVWYRDRAERLFNFRYRIEIYVPEPKRVFGYYVMPFMLDGELVARVDLKSDRHSGRLLVRGTFLEDSQDPSRVSSALAAELKTMAEWLGLVDVVVSNNGNLAAPLRRVL